MYTNIKTSALAKSFLSKDLYKDLIIKIELFLDNTNLDKNQRKDLIKLFEEIFNEGYTSNIID